MATQEIMMSLKEATRLEVIKRLDKEELTTRQASEELRLCVKQVRRIRKRYLEEGVVGLISRNRGKVSANKTPSAVRDRVIDLLRNDYEGFGPTFTSEKLSERNQIKISRETIRKWMMEEGLWKGKQKRVKRVYQRRARRSRFGELVQIDGSPHDWFERRGEKCCLIHFIDDATNEITGAKFVPTERGEGYLDCLKEHLNKYGRPLSLYSDKHVIFKVSKEEIKKGEGITHFGRVLKDLDIKLIYAHSPQAKGRIERSNGVLQDRLIKEMRLEGINSIEEGNEFLPRFLEKHNKRFRKEAVSQEDAHRAMRKEDDLERIFARRDKRKLSKDLTFQHRGTLYLLKSVTPNRLRYASVDVFWKEGQPIEVEYNGKRLDYEKWAERKYEQPRVLDAKEIGGVWLSKKATKPSRSHPWR
ncbi:MAG: hypothetical protein K1000chlam2_01838 [Chlamydiae bacterium]|nr:hypothetical protein [Chlamydiota bacterium]